MIEQQSEQNTQKEQHLKARFRHNDLTHPVIQVLLQLQMNKLHSPESK